SRPTLWQALQCLATMSLPLRAAPPAAAAATAPTPLHSWPATQTSTTGFKRSAMASLVVATALTAHRANTAALATSTFLVQFTLHPHRGYKRARPRFASRRQYSGRPGVPKHVSSMRHRPGSVRGGL